MTIAETVNAYLWQFPAEKAKLGLLLSQLADGETLNDRKNYRGHVCGSGITLSPDKKQILLIHHNIFQRWQQPGGHMDANEIDPLETSRRETWEETSVEVQSPWLWQAGGLIPIYIDSHLVRANPSKDEPEHYHHDFRYIFVAASRSLKLRPEEVSQAAWVDLDDSKTAQIAQTLQKMRDLNLI